MVFLGFFIFSVFVGLCCLGNGDVAAAILAVGFFTAIGAMAQGAYWRDIDQLSTTKGRQKLRDDVKRQDKYDNEWGIIDFSDKHRK